jgi:hypothetical protein
MSTHHWHERHGAFIAEVYVPSTGKSSNSSSSSNAAAGLGLLEGVDEASFAVAFVVGAAPDAGAAGIVPVCFAFGFERFCVS